jgi:hypothetical protein
MPEPTWEEQAEALDGLYIDMLDPWEYKHLLDAGLLRITNDKAAQFLGTARLRRVSCTDPHEVQSAQAESSSP